MTNLHVPLCVHYRLQHFAGSARFDAGNGIALWMQGAFDGLDAGQPVQLDVELPQRREMPWWFRAYVAICPGLSDAQLHARKPRVTVELEADPVSCYLAWIDCAAWTITLPGWPVPLAIETICGYLPLHFVVRQNSTEYGRFVLQQRRRCVHINHDAASAAVSTQA